MKQQVPEFVVGWGTLALINAGLAQTKDRSALAWFLISLLLGPVATLVIVLLSKAEPSVGIPTRRKPFNLEDHRKQ
jgi:hypothetical protein